METIADRIKKLRKAKKFNQENFAKGLGIGQAAISALEKGIRNVTEPMILLICSTYDANEDWLRTGEGGDDNMFKKTSHSLIDKISEEYKLDDFQKKLVYEYLNLTNQQKNAVKSFLDKIYNFDAENFEKPDMTSTEQKASELSETTNEQIPIQMSREERDDLLERYRNDPDSLTSHEHARLVEDMELDLQKKQTSSQLDSQDETQTG